MGQKFNPRLGTGAMQDIASFFDISEDRSKALFINQVGYGTRLQVLAALRVLLLEKMAQEMGVDGLILPRYAKAEGDPGFANLELV